MSYLTLFITSFLAGSFVPLGSEALLIYLEQQGMNHFVLISMASLGNTLGGMSCYYIAKIGGRPLIKKYLKHNEQKLDSWKKKLHSKGEWTALLCWLPFVGEIIASALGLISDKPIKVALFMLIGKLFRYIGVIEFAHLFMAI